MPRKAVNPVALIVLDGWGYRAERAGNAIALANVPTWDRIWSRTPRTLLEASGLAVGLPTGQMGNSEVGHLNLGAGRVVQQDTVRISQAIADGSLQRNSALVQACERARTKGSMLHFVGLIGDGGVHALDEHLFGLVDIATRLGVSRIAIHGLMDGRDTLPTSGLRYMQELLAHVGQRARVASLGGRYFGMDRDKRWERTEKFYRPAVDGIGMQESDPVIAIENAYRRGETDEFITPVVITRDGIPIAPMRDGDEVICFNFRADRMRQIVRALTDPEFAGFDVTRRPQLNVTLMTAYDRSLSLPVLFDPFSMARIVAEVVSEAGLSMYRTAETEKYAHVTYFFNGGIEIPFRGEERCLVPSQKVATYDLMPEMSAPGVTDVLCAALEQGEQDFILCNYANADMVGHTGSLPATIHAVETVDRCLERVVRSAEKAGATLLITADHGNCEYMIDAESGGPHTAHTCNPVPFVIVGGSGDSQLRSGGALCDVGPTILAMLGVEKPNEMSGVDLRVV